MDKLGASLQKQRKSLKLSVEDLVSQTRIPLRFIEAIEADDFAKLPNHVSAKGFLRSYAEAIDLDPAEISSAYSELCDSEDPMLFTGDRDSMLSNLQVKRPTRVPFPRRVIFSVATVIVLLLVVVAFFPKNGSEEALKQPQILSPEEVFQEPNILGSEETVSLEKSSKPIILASPEGQKTETNSEILVVEKDPLPLEPVAEDLIAAKKIPDLERLPETSELNSVMMPGDEIAPASQASSEEGSQRSDLQVTALVSDDISGETSQKTYVLSLEATEPSWVEVTIDDNVVKEALLQPNDRVEWRATEKFKLTLGNAGGVKVALNGQDLGVFGPSGEVVHKEITAALLQEIE